MEERDTRMEPEEEDVEAHARKGAGKKLSAQEEAADEAEEPDVEGHSLRQPPTKY